MAVNVSSRIAGGFVVRSLVFIHDFLAIRLLELCIFCVPVLLHLLREERVDFALKCLQGCGERGEVRDAICS